MEAQPITASVNVLGTDFPVQSVQLKKRIGAPTTGSASIQMLQGKKGQPVSGEEVAALSRTFNDAILNKDDTEPNVRINLVGQINFEGILLGAKGSIDASGSAMFSVSFAEPAWMLNAMKFDCYPDGNSLTQSNTAPVETLHPFAAKVKGGGSIASRLVKLYRVALESYMDTGSFSDIYCRSQREVNKALESVFLGVMERSISTTNPDWLNNSNSLLDYHLNDELATLLFSKGANLWQALMRVAHKTDLVYVGDFERGGFFRQLEFDGGSIDLSTPPVRSRNLSLGRPGQQTISQVAAYPAPKHMGGEEQKIKPNTAAQGASEYNRTMLAAYPEEPNPKNGKTITKIAPSWFTLGRETTVRNTTKSTMDGKTQQEADKTALEAQGKNTELETNRKDMNEPLRLWCRDQYHLLRARNLHATVQKPFTTNEYALGTPAKVAEGLSGVLSGVTHEVSVRGDTGSATTTYNVAYVGAVS